MGHGSLISTEQRLCSEQWSERCNLWGPDSFRCPTTPKSLLLRMLHLPSPSPFTSLPTLSTPLIHYTHTPGIYLSIYVCIYMSSVFYTIIYQTMCCYNYLFILKLIFIFIFIILPFVFPCLFNLIIFTNFFLSSFCHVLFNSQLVKKNLYFEQFL